MRVAAWCPSERLCESARRTQTEPWVNPSTWRHAVASPLQRGDARARATLLALLQPRRGGLMWRTSKDSVAHELGIPQQRSAVRTLQLSAVERHAYRRRHKETAESARQVLPEAAVDCARARKALPPALDRALTQRETDTLLPRLLHLRQERPALRAPPRLPAERTALTHDAPPAVQICCHPQVGGEHALAATGAHAAPKTMDDVLRDLVERDRDEAEDAQRSLLAACNGVAGLALLLGRKGEAAAQYRVVIDAADKHRGVCDVDSLTLIHALVNLGARPRAATHKNKSCKSDVAEPVRD